MNSNTAFIFFLTVSNNNSIRFKHVEHVKSTSLLMQTENFLLPDILQRWKFQRKYKNEVV